MHMDLTEHKGLIREILHRLVAEGAAAPDAVSQSQPSPAHTHGQGGVKKEEAESSDDDGGSSSGSGSGSGSGSSSEEEDDDEEEDNGKGKQKKKEPSSGGGGNKGGGFNKEHAWSEEMAAFLGVGYLSRPQVTKRLWAYIKGNNLQKPGDGRVILCDAALKTLFGVDSINMFKMTKEVNKHLRVDDREVKEEDDEEEEEEDEDDSDDEGDSRKKKRKSPAKSKKSSSSSNGGGGSSATKKNKKPSPAKKKAKKSSKKADDPDKPKRKSSFPTERLSADLQAVVGKDAAPRTEVVKLLWAYIKANNMQNPNDKREIICDARFKVIFGMDRVSGFSMNKYLKPHFLGKV